MNNANHLLIFARLPKPGTNKTRLIPALGGDKATLVYRSLLNRTLDEARRSAATASCVATICFTGGSTAEAMDEFGDAFTLVEQTGESLGDRLKHATTSAFVDGAKRVVVIGTDCPSLTADDLKAAFQQLERHDLVIGPAFDGGYYLIGLAGKHSSLFDGIDWSTPIVFQQTTAKAQALNLKTHSLRQLGDIDYPEDLLDHRRGTAWTTLPLATDAGKLSVVIPTWNEASNIAETLRRVGNPEQDLEIIVVDAGSSDSTMQIAQQHGCKCFASNPGRAIQMNAGAAIATGEYLLFLHADTLLPEGYRKEIV
ncbi:MAG: TIGR04282 family arsenosugar biosynthesis glycosyltransferase, partial [Pirellulaceae bacterium]